MNDVPCGFAPLLRRKDSFGRDLTVPVRFGLCAATEFGWVRTRLSTAAANSGRLRPVSLSGVRLSSAKSRSKIVGNCVLLAFAALLSACANSPASRVDAPRAEPARAEGMTVRYELVKSAGIDPAERETREGRAAAAFMPACEKPYTRGVATLLTGAADVVRNSRTIDVLASLPNQVAVLDGDFDRCLKRFGATGYNYLQMSDGQDSRIPQYITRSAALLLNAEETHMGSAGERQRTGAEMLIALAAIVRAGAQVNSDPSRAGPDTAEAGQDDAAPAKPASSPSRRGLARPSISP